MRTGPTPDAGAAGPSLPRTNSAQPLPAGVGRVVRVDTRAAAAAVISKLRLATTPSSLEVGRVTHRADTYVSAVEVEAAVAATPRQGLGKVDWDALQRTALDALAAVCVPPSPCPPVCFTRCCALHTHAPCFWCKM